MDIFKLVGSIYVDNTAANESISKTSENAEGLGTKLKNGIGTAAKWAAGVAAAAVAVGTAMYKATEEAAQNLDEIQKGAQQMSMTYENYQELSYALERSGTTIDSVSKGMKNITDDLADVANGASDASENYDKLGVSLTNADGTMRSSEDVMIDSLKALADMDDETQRNALANDIFGKSYTDLIPLLNEGSEGISDLMQNAEDLGIVMSDEAVDAGATFCDTVDDLKDSFSSLATGIGADMMPMLQSVIEWIQDHMPEIRETVSEVITAIMDIIKALIPVIESLAPIVETLWTNLIKPVLDGVCDFLTNVFSGNIKGAFESIINTIKSIFGGLLAILRKPLDSFLTLLGTWWTKATEPFRKLADKIGSIWESIKSMFKLPHFTLSGTLNPLKWATQGMPSIGVEWYAKGGILNDPTMFGVNPYTNNAMVGGEAGAEAIAPIDTLENYFKKWSVNEELNDKIDNLVEVVSAYLPDIANKKLVLDTGAVVGGMSDSLNKSLYKYQTKEKRGL